MYTRKRVLAIQYEKTESGNLFGLEKKGRIWFQKNRKVVVEEKRGGQLTVL